jgi:hypothetical protein
LLLVVTVPVGLRAVLTGVDWIASVNALPVEGAPDARMAVPVNGAPSLAVADVAAGAAELGVAAAGAFFFCMYI